MPRKPTIVANIAEELLPLAVPIASLTPDDRNARRHGPKNLAAIAASLRRFGQRQPLVVVGGIVRAGNGRLLAAQQLGWTHVAVIESADDEPEALAYALADNRTAELASWDPMALSEALSEIGKEDAIGWDDDELEVLLSIAWKPPEGTDSGGGGGGSRASSAVVLKFDAAQLSQLKAIAVTRGWEGAPESWAARIVEVLR